MKKLLKNTNITCFLTGGTGLLGNVLAEKLLAMGVRVVMLVRDQVPMSRFCIEQSLFKDAIIVHGDILDQQVLRRTMFEYQVDCVFHLAAQTLVGIAHQDPETTLKVNIEGTWNMLEAYRAYAETIKKKSALIVASSDKAYGNLKGKSYTEEFPLKGENPYDVSKSCADLITQSYWQTYGLNVGVTRCGNFFGPGDINGSRLIPHTILSCLANRDPIIRSNGKLIRDYIYVGDGADAYITLADHLLKKDMKNKRCFNFSYGERRSVLDVTKTIIRLMNSSVNPQVKNIAHHEIPLQHLDSALARKVLKWKPETGFIEGLEKTIEWYSAHATELKTPLQ